MTGERTHPDGPAPTGAAGPRSTRTLLAALCSATLFLCAGTHFGPVFGDETPLLRNVLHFADERSLVPTHFSYPTLYSYVLAAWTAAAACVSWVFTSQHPVDFAFGLKWSIEGSYEFGTELFAVRTLQAVLTVALVLGAYFLGREAWGRREGLTAAAIVACGRVLAERAGWVLPDLFGAVLTTAAAVLCVRVVRGRVPSGTPTGAFRLLVIAAALAGAAIASKYNGALALLAVFAARCGAPAGLTRGSAPARVAGDWVRLGLVCAAAFAVCLPALFVDPGSYWRGFRREALHMTEGQLGIDLGELPFLWIPIRFLQREWFVGGVFLAALAAIPFLRRDRATWVLAAPVLAAVVVVGPWKYTSLHYLLWAYPLLAVLGARALWTLAARAGAPSGVVVALLAAGLAPSAVDSAKASLRGIRDPNNLVAAERWVESRIPAGSHVDNDWYALPTLWSEGIASDFRASVAARPRLTGRAASVERKPTYRGSLGYVPEPPDAARLRRDRPEWVVASSQSEPASAEPLRGYASDHLREGHRRLFEFYDALRRGGDYELAAEFADGPGPTIRVWRRVSGPR